MIGFSRFVAEPVMCETIKRRLACGDILSRTSTNNAPVSVAHSVEYLAYVGRTAAIKISALATLRL